MTNVQSPESQSSKGSNSLDEDYVLSSTVPDVLANFVTNNYGNNYYVADQDGLSNGDSLDGLGLDDMDEIDTNNMTTYKAVPAKKDRSGGAGKFSASVKQEPVDLESLAMPESLVLPSAGKSLLMPSETNAGNSSQIDADMLNALADQELNSGNILPGPSSADPMVAQNTMFDENSQVSQNPVIRMYTFF